LQLPIESKADRSALILTISLDARFLCVS